MPRRMVQRNICAHWLVGRFSWKLCSACKVRLTLALLEMLLTQLHFRSSVPKAHYRSPSSHTPRAVSVMEGDHPPPLRPKPALNLPLTKSESTNLSNSTIYAKTRPMTLSTSGQHGIAANLMDWARAIAPPSRPPRSQGVTSPTHADIPTENIAPSSSAASTPSPQWAPV